MRGYDCGDQVADWLSEKLYENAKVKPKVRLMYVGIAPEELNRPAFKPPFFNFPQYKEGDVVSYRQKCFHHKLEIILNRQMQLVELKTKSRQLNIIFTST